MIASDYDNSRKLRTSSDCKSALCNTVWPQCIKLVIFMFSFIKHNRRNLRKSWTENGIMWIACAAVWTRKFPSTEPLKCMQERALCQSTVSLAKIETYSGKISTPEKCQDATILPHNSFRGHLCTMPIRRFLFGLRVAKLLEIWYRPTRKIVSSKLEWINKKHG